MDFEFGHSFQFILRRPAGFGGGIPAGRSLRPAKIFLRNSEYLPQTSDIHTMDHVSGAWIAAGIVSAFLIVCGEYNHRTGYKKVRTSESPIDAAIVWLTALRNSLSALPREAELTRRELNRRANPSLLPDSPSYQFDTEQLIRLGAALRATETSLDTVELEKQLVGPRV
jgi:hypothetical protein